MMHVYVAGAWLEQATRAKPVIRALRNKGIAITHDWTLPDGHPDLVPNASAPMQKDQYKLDAVIRRGYALADLRGVREADLVYLAVPSFEGLGAGCFVETGYAFAIGRPVVFAGENWKSTIFSDLGVGRFDTDEEAIRAVFGITIEEPKPQCWGQSPGPQGTVTPCLSGYSTGLNDVHYPPCPLAQSKIEPSL